MSRLYIGLSGGVLGGVLAACGGSTSSTEPPSAKLLATVASKVDISCPAWDANAVYVGGLCATYQGNIYKAKWWVKGDVPNTDPYGPWALVSVAPTPTP
ncbi:MAG TPA: hypothetical protein DCW29_12875, partial [Janthinobacterium sp.]|nr:hypothetical protein [Janthinobacterium sp.]